MKVSLFITCLRDILNADVGKDTLEILEHVGCEVDFPKSQTRCGQPAFNSGYLQESKKSFETYDPHIQRFRICCRSIWILCWHVEGIS